MVENFIIDIRNDFEPPSSILTSSLYRYRYQSWIPSLAHPFIDTTTSAECTHRYLNKWDGEYPYHCMNPVCNNCTIIDASRIALEEERERNTPVDVVQASSSVGKLSQERGIPIGFLIDFTNYYDCWDWTSWDVIRRIIKPATEATRCRFVELPELKRIVGPAHTFISYAQAGKWGDLVAAVSDGGADKTRRVWIDIFAVRQWPCASPDLDFGGTIEHCRSYLIVCSSLKEVRELAAPDMLSRKSSELPLSIRKQIAFLRVWCLFELHKATTVEDMVIILKGGSYQRDIKGSVIFVPDKAMLENLGILIDINQAEATVESDKKRILDGIRSTCGTDHLNNVARRVIIGSAYHTHHDVAIVQCAACGDDEAKRMVLIRLNYCLKVAAGFGFRVLLSELLAHGADVLDKDHEGYTALMRASFGHERCLKMLLAHGADVHAKHDDGSTALIIASTCGHENCVEMLLAHGADLHAKDNDYGVTALGYASIGGHERCVEVLLAHGAHLNAKDNEGRTALIGASISGHERCIDVLLAHGADVQAETDTGMTALEYASAAGHERCLEILLAHGARQL